MTEEYKEQLLNYITNDVTKEDGNNIPVFDDIKTYENKLNTFLSQYISTVDYYYSGFLQLDNNSNYIIYGKYTTTAHQQIFYGFMVILDANLNPIKFLNQYSSGTLFRQFEVLNTDEEGNIFGVDYTWDFDGQGQVINEQKRFIMLNNVLTSNLSYGDYTAVLRKSYIMSYTDFETSQIYKDNDSATYVMVGHNIVNNNNRISVITLKVNVGEENEWHIYNSIYTYFSTIGSFIIWGNNSFQLKIVTTFNNGFSEAKYRELIFDGSTYTENLLCDLPIITTVGASYIKNIVFKDFDDIYYQLGQFKLLLKTNYETSSYDILYQDNLSGNLSCSMKMLNINNNIFLGMYVRDYDESENYLTFGMIIGKDVYFSETLTVEYVDVALFLVKNNFNLYEIMYQSGDDLYILPLDYNPNNYNGETYIDYNSLIAHKGRLYNNNRMIFARNIYNKTSLNNVTVSTIQIPNGMLNDINIDIQELLGETNLSLVKNNNVITKNVYETVFLNFINTTNVIDEDTNIKYPSASNYINTNINIGTKQNSENSSIGKVRINYTDSTTRTIDIEWETIDETHKKVDFALYVKKDITSIDFMSNDLSTIYCKKELEIEVGNYYKITQYLRME